MAGSRLVGLDGWRHTWVVWGALKTFLSFRRRDDRRGASAGRITGSCDGVVFSDEAEGGITKEKWSAVRLCKYVNPRCDMVSIYIKEHREPVWVFRFFCSIWIPLLLL